MTDTINPIQPASGVPIDERGDTQPPRGVIGAQKPDTDFIAKIANSGLDLDDGKELVIKNAQDRFNADHGDELESRTVEYEAAQSEADRIDTEYGNVCRDAAATPEWQRVARKSGKRDQDDDAEVPFKDWSFLDQGLTVATLVLSVVMLGAGAANIQGNLVGSGLPIFTLNPLFAWLFAMLAPAAALAIHCFGHAFRTWRMRNFYRMGIYALTLITVIAWSWLFADLFHGTGGLDLDFEGSGLADTLFVWLQIVAEIMVGSSLFLIAEHIAGKYSPNWWVRNTEYVELRERQTVLGKERETAFERLSKAKGAFTALMGRREATINADIAEYLQRRRRFGDN
ncbi:hypothetical protein [Maricaulis alexandrii]|uniref:hypothetical protein n=1 Tax=Maricaulis alexandrii TaxID=2570354 RepID=UPI0011092706|nr:hypothetical protein [Maricaulis alexandrii]